MTSEYLKTLLLENRDVGERYPKKLKLINNVNPFTLKLPDLDNSIHAVPPVTNMDIVSFLVLTHSYYTKAQMKAYKSLQSFKYFESGFVINAGTKVENNFYILVGQVKHSQKGNSKALDVWCIVAQDGSISTAHCTCMAGSSEVCSHVGAILFAAEYANKRKEEVSCTDVLGAWMVPSTSSQIPLEPVNKMDFGKCIVHENKSITPMSATDINDMLKKMVELGHNAAVMRIIEPFASDIAKKIGNILQF